jgi:hypothetical protein
LIFQCGFVRGNPLPRTGNWCKDAASWNNLDEIIPPVRELFVYIILGL